MEASDTKTRELLQAQCENFTQIGASHVRRNKPNQDYGAVESIAVSLDNQIYVLAVSDGHGSEKSFRSDIGSKTAVNVAIEELKNLFSKQPSFDQINSQTDIITRRIIFEWKKLVKIHFIENPVNNEDIEIKSDLDIQRIYGATLLIALITSEYVLYLQIGDGNILAVDGSGNYFEPFEVDPLILGTDTHSLCEEDAIEYCQIRVVPHQYLPLFVFITTDGLPNSFASDKDFSSSVVDIYHTIKKHGLEPVKDEMKGWLKDYTEQGSGDDITIAFYYLEQPLEEEFSGDDVVFEGADEYSYIKDKEVKESLSLNTIFPGQDPKENTNILQNNEDDDKGSNRVVESEIKDEELLQKAIEETDNVVDESCNLPEQSFLKKPKDLKDLKNIFSVQFNKLNK